ncbi:hypothetical protein DFJ63DRAFT_315604 [Scheffersomyces coipomensis]|uniref:uncharacterized protein n=1 Tax=Scheffersomyces coipomensis TaxID=1788519 RepID=UPI00315CCBB9
MTTPTYSPQHNGRAERAVGKVKQITRTLLNHIPEFLKPYLTPYAIIHATELMNRWYHTSIQDTPLHQFLGRTPTNITFPYFAEDILLFLPKKEITKAIYLGYRNLHSTHLFLLVSEPKIVVHSNFRPLRTTTFIHQIPHHILNGLKPEDPLNPLIPLIQQINYQNTKSAAKLQPSIDIQSIPKDNQNIPYSNTISHIPQNILTAKSRDITHSTKNTLATVQ